MSFRITVADEESGAVVGDYQGVPPKIAFAVATIVNQALSALKTTAQVKGQVDQLRSLLGLLGIDQSAGKRRRP